MITLKSPAFTDIDLERSTDFADGLIIAHPDLQLVEVAYSWCTPDQARSLVDALRHIRQHPYRGEDREVSMVVAGLSLESCCDVGFLYLDDVAFTPQQAEWLETEAMRAVLATERA